MSIRPRRTPDAQLRINTRSDWLLSFDYCALQLSNRTIHSNKVQASEWRRCDCVLSVPPFWDITRTLKTFNSAGHCLTFTNVLHYNAAVPAFGINTFKHLQVQQVSAMAFLCVQCFAILSFHNTMNFLIAAWRRWTRVTAAVPVIGNYIFQHARID